MSPRGFFQKALGLVKSVVKSVGFGNETPEHPENSTIEVEVRTAWRSLRCGECHRKAVRLHGTEGKLRTWRQLGIFGLRVHIRCHVYRVLCRRCGVRTMDTPWARTGSLFTRAFEDEVAWFLQHTDQSTTAEYFDISWETAGRIAARVANEKRDPSLLDGLKIIGVDEICYGRPLKFLTVIVNHATGRVVWSGAGKSSAVLGQFFEKLGVSGRSTIKVVTMDMGAAYEKAVRDHLPEAEIVFDRFHVVKLANEAVDEVRRGEMRTSAPGRKKQIKGYRWPTLKNPWNLTRREKERLAELPRINKRLYRAYLLKETFQQVFDSQTPEEADRSFADWYGWARRSQIEPIRRLAQSLKDRWQGVRRFVQLRLTNAVVEGFNSKIRMLSHRAFGFHSADALIAMISLCCSGIHIRPLGH
jgi:transposase